MGTRLRPYALSTALTALVLTAVAVPPADAQYFGRNKVQYERFDFEVLETEHFDIYYYAEEGLAVELAALMAERWYARLSRVLNHDLTGRQILILYANGADFRQTNVLSGDISEATGGVTEILKRRMVLPFAGALPETDHVLGHELVHAFQFDMTGEGGGVLKEGVPAVMRAPLWFVEGMAEYLSIGPADPNTAMWMRDAVREELPDVGKLQDPRFFPYRYGHALWSYIAGRWGDDVVGRVLKATRASSGNLRVAFGRVLRVPLDTVVGQWHEATREYYGAIRPDTTSPGTPTPVHAAWEVGSQPTYAADAHGRLLIGPKSGGGQVNLAPALSPDGEQIVFYSERDLFSINMFLADAETGEVRRRIVETAVNPHIESIQFIHSAGAWDLDSRRFVFAGLKKGQPTLSIYDSQTDEVVRERDFPEIGEIFNPVWSPDGRRVAFSGHVGGLADLFIWDLEQDAVERLTNDPYADIQPAWSPDGRYIAYVTDRFTTGLASLMYGDYRIALLDTRTGAVTEMPGFARGKHINPQWGPEGHSLYFISDRNGISNVYRRDMVTGDITQITNLYTGVSGIMGLSPALSVAAGTGRLAMTVYEHDQHLIYTIDETTQLAGGPVQPEFPMDPAVLPPARRMTNDLAALLSNAFYGLPRDTTYPSRPYSTRLGLDYVGVSPPAFGIDRFGTFIAGGAALYWSDILGDKSVVTALSLNGSFKDVGGVLAYQNLSNRLNWGVGVQQTPYRVRYRAPRYVQDESGNLLIQDDLVDLRQTTRSAGGSISYPLSQVQRLELSGGYMGMSFTFDVRRTLYLLDGTPISDTTLSDDLRDPVHLAQAGVALVYDNSLFGITGPILGQRYRLEWGLNTGTLDYHTALADYRKYLMPVRPVTLAFRMMHYGRYGASADDNFFYPLNLGYDGLVRGYSFSRIDLLEECPFLQPSTVTGTYSCPLVDQLFGSKIVVGNVELRAPLLGALGFGGGLFNALPIEAVFFADAGLAWWNASLPENFEELPPDHQDAVRNDRNSRSPFFLEGGTREPVYSAGGGLRLNVLGMVVASIYYVYPFNRPKGGHIQFGLTPGF
jgi:Tol biopolymer transport system component